MRSGEVFYPSLIAPIAEGHEGLDILQVLIETAHQENIKVKAWIPKSHDQVAYAKDPEWGDDDIYEHIFKNIKSRYPGIRTSSWLEYGRWSEQTIKRLAALREIE